jgi:hypothetical protein
VRAAGHGVVGWRGGASGGRGRGRFGGCRGGSGFRCGRGGGGLLLL